MAISSSFSNLEEAMDKIWFHKNILFFQPSNFNILSLLQKDGNILKSTTSSEDCSFYEPVLIENNKNHTVQKMKNLERLNIPTNKICSEDKIPQPTVLRMPKIMSGLWSSYELESLNGLGFVFSKRKFSYRSKKMEEGRRPYPSEAWFINRADSPLLNLRMLPKTIEGTDMKRYLRSWAQRVASLVCQERCL